MPQGFTDSPYLMQIPKADMDDRIFPMVKFYFSVIYGWFASLFFSSLLTGRDHPLGKAFSLKGFKVTKEKLQFFFQAWVCYLVPLTSEQALPLISR